MPGKCSSQKNGCATCSPSLSLWSIGAATSLNKEGFTCLVGEDDYVYYTSSSKARYYEYILQIWASVNVAIDGICDFERPYTSWAGNSYLTSQKKYETDGFGNIYFYNLYSYNYFSKDAYNDYIKKEFKQTAEIDMNACPPKIDIISECKGESSIIYPAIPWIPGSQDTMYDPCDEDHVMPGLATCGCENNPPIIASCGSGGTCTESFDTLANNATYITPQGHGYCDGEVNGYTGCELTTNTNLTDRKGIKDLYDLCKSSMQTKMVILESNAPQDCNGTTCGEGPDACWSTTSSFGIGDNNLNDPSGTSTIAQKIKFKIGAAKEGFDEKYRSISGKVIFYIPSEEDIEQDRTPCCNNDFDGSIVEEIKYALTAGSTFKDNYYAVDCGQFDDTSESLVGVEEIISICYTVDEINFI